MTADEHITRISQLEILFSQQEYTIETLNEVVTRQTQDIDQLMQQIDLLKHQLKELKQQMPEVAVVNEKPPHY